jgi:hypothetical protein
MCARNAGATTRCSSHTRGYIEYYHADAPETDKVELAKREFDRAVKLPETTATDPFSQQVIADASRRSSR